jgi:glycosyltransferase involved in cell wall biosynthesis
VTTVRQIHAFTKAGQPRWINLDALFYSDIIQKTGANHIHSHFADRAAKTSLAISIWTGLPFTFTVHGYDIFFEPPENYSQLVEKAKYIFTISHFNRAYLIDRFHFQETKVKVIYCGIILKDFQGISFKHNNSDAGVSLLTVARLHPVKGHKFLLQALDVLRKTTRFKYELFLAGDGSEMNSLKDLAVQLKLTEVVHFLGNQSQSQVCDLLQKCDYFVLPSISEGLPIVLLEAMASSRLVIAPNVNGVPELVIDNETGLLFEPANSESLALAIERAVTDQDKSATMIKAAREKVVTQFSKDRAIDLLISYWRD